MSVMIFAVWLLPLLYWLSWNTFRASESFKTASAVFLLVVTIIFLTPPEATYCSNFEYDTSLLSELSSI